MTQGLDLLPVNLPPSSSSRIEALRRKGAEYFRERGLPSRRDEDWRYLSLKPLLETKFQSAFQGGMSLEKEAYHQLAASLQSGWVNFVFVNGALDRSLSDLNDLPSGVRLGEVSVDQQDFADSLDALAAAHFGHGLTISVAAGVRVLEPLCLRFHVASGNGPAMMVHPHVRVEMGEGSEAHFVEWYSSQDGTKAFTNTTLEVDLSPRSRMQVVRLQDEGSRSLHIGRSRFALSEDSELMSLSVFQGASLCRHDLRVDVKGPRAKLAVHSIASLVGEQQLDQFSQLDHRIGEATTVQVSKALLAGRSKSSFTGRILIRPNAQKTDSSQLSKALLLSEGAESNTRPQLMIEADDVKAAHGATVGQLNNDEIFYLRSRGLSKARAEQMLSFAFLSEELETVKNPQIKEFVSSSLRRGFERLGEELA